MARSPELEELWKKIQAKRDAYYREHYMDKEVGVICPFTDDMKCIGGCTSNQERACVNGED